MNVFVIYNPVAGMQRAQELQKITNSLTQMRIDYVVHATTLDEGPLKLLENFNELFDTLLVAGGDGTLSETIQAMQTLNIQVPIQILPTGTTNELASNFISNTNFNHIVQNLFKETITEVDIGLSNNDRIVSYALSFGNFTDVTYKTPQKLKNYLGYKAYILFGFLTFRRIKSYKLTVISDEVNISDSFVFGSVSNTKTVGNVIVFEENSVILDDGYFEVLLVKKPKSLKQLRIILQSLRNQNFDNDLFYNFKTNDIQFISKKEVSWNHDGEFGGKFKEKRLKVLKKKIKFFN